MVFETERMRLPVAARGRATRRAALFRESLPEIAERWVLGFAWAMSPQAHPRRAEPAAPLLR